MPAGLCRAAAALVVGVLAWSGGVAEGRYTVFSHKLACTFALRRVEAWYGARCMNVTSKSLNFANAMHDALYTCKHADTRAEGVRIASDFLESPGMNADRCPGVREEMRRFRRREEVRARWARDV